MGSARGATRIQSCVDAADLRYRNAAIVKATSLHKGILAQRGIDYLAMAWFKREKRPIENPTPVDERRVRTEGLWTKCSSCGAIIWKKDLETNWEVCPKCDHHFRLSARRRLDLLLDDARWIEHDTELIVELDPSALSPNTEGIRHPPQRRAEKAWHEGRNPYRRRQSQRPARRLLFDGVRFHRRVDGSRRWRKSRTSH